MLIPRRVSQVTCWKTWTDLQKIGNRKGHELNHLAETTFPWFWLSALPELLDTFFQAPPENSAMGTRKVDAQPSYCCSEIRLYNHLRCIQNHVNNDRFSISTGDRRIFEPSSVFEAGDTFSKGPSFWRDIYSFNLLVHFQKASVVFSRFLVEWSTWKHGRTRQTHSFKRLYFINNFEGDCVTTWTWRIIPWLVSG